MRPFARRWRGAVLGASALALAACSGGGSGESTSGTGAVAPAEFPPVPAPADLALECVMPTPDATWEKARGQIGGAAAFLPRSGGGVVAVGLHFPLAVAEAIDGRVPAVCAATLAKDGTEPHGVIGVHLRWPDRLLDGLTKGADAKFKVHTDPATQIEMLEARDPKDAVGATGVLGNYLLIAARAEDLATVGPYVARTMPLRAREFPTAGVRIVGVEAPPAVDLVVRVPAAALGGPIAAAGTRAFTGLSARLATMVPFSLESETAAALAAASAVAADTEGAELRLVLDERRMRVEASAVMRKGSAGEKVVRELAAGSAAPLLALPKDTLAGLFVRQTQAAVTAGAGSQAAAIAKALGVSEGKDAAKIEAAATAFGAARGDWIAAGFSFDGTGPSAFVRAAVKDGEALEGALKDFVALADGATPKDPVRGQKLRVSTGKTVLENIAGDVYRVRLARSSEAAKKGAEPPAAATDTPAAVDVLFRRSDDVFVAATGYASRDALRALMTAPSGESLQKVAEVAKPIEALGSDVSVAMFFDPSRISASRAGKPSTVAAPVVIGMGRTPGDVVTVFAKLEAPSDALAELSRWLGP